MSARSHPLIDALEAHEGIVCVVGAGGKKSILYRLLREHGGRAALTATVHTTEFPADLPAERIVAAEDALAARVLVAARSHSVAYACPSDKPGRLAGVSAPTLRSLHARAGFAATFVKADGARMRWIKAPAGDEPVTVPDADIFVTVVSARAIDEPLSDRVAHRVERVAAVTGVIPGMPLTSEAVARLLASEDGALRGAGRARVVPVINMVDNDAQERKARAVAEAALAMTARFDRVVLGCLRSASDPVVDVVTR